MKRYLLTIAFLLAWPLLAHAQIMYFVSTTGNDSNSGTSPATAWRTVQNAVNSINYSYEAIIYVQQGVYNETVTISNPGVGPASNQMTCYGGNVTVGSITVLAANWVISPCISGGAATPTPSVTPTPGPTSTGPTPTATQTPGPYAPGGVTHIVSGTSITVLNCTPGAGWDWYSQNPLTGDTTFTLPNTCADGATIFYEPTNTNGNSYAITLGSGSNSLVFDVAGGGFLQIPASPGSPTTIIYEFKYDLINQYWHVVAEETIPAQPAPIQNCSGDINSGCTQVSGIQGFPVSPNTPVAGCVFTGTGTSYNCLTPTPSSTPTQTPAPTQTASPTPTPTKTPTPTPTASPTPTQTPGNFTCPADAFVGAGQYPFTFTCSTMTATATPTISPTPTPSPVPTAQHAGVGSCTSGGAGTILNWNVDAAPSCVTPTPSQTPTPSPAPTAPHSGVGAVALNNCPSLTLNTDSGPTCPTSTASPTPTLSPTPTATPTPTLRDHWTQFGVGSGQMGTTACTAESTCNYLPPLAVTASANLTNTESRSQLPAPVAGTIKTLTCNVNTAQGTGSADQVKMRVAGADPSPNLTVTMTNSATPVTDSTHSVAVTAGQLMDFEDIMTTSGTITNHGLNCTIDYVY